MKKLNILLLVFVAAFTACKKTPEVNLKYVDVERDLLTVGTTTATVQCDYEYITTLKKAFFYYSEGTEEIDMNTAEMRVAQNTLYVDLTGLRENTTYSYYYEFVNGFNSMRSAAKTFKTEAGNGGGDEPPTPPEIMLPTIITAVVTEITTNSAKSGGEVTNDGGAEVTERGVCWSTNANPTLNDSHMAVGTGIGAFTATMSGLEANTIFHVRAYAVNEKGTAYGLDKEFATLSGGGVGEHEWVDLGLPSGTLWATCNVGADTPEDYGDYFAWGETSAKTTYNWGTYQYDYCILDIRQLTKYCNDSHFGYNGFADTLTTLLPEDDAATANWGSGWCMPTDDQWVELLLNTTNTLITQNGVSGRLFAASNGNSLFLPMAGSRWDDEFYNFDIYGCYYGYYWSSSLCIGNPHSAWGFYDGSDGCCKMNMEREYGQSVRAVRSISQN